MIRSEFWFSAGFWLSISKEDYAEIFGKSPLKVGPAGPLRIPGWNSGWVLSIEELIFSCFMLGTCLLYVCTIFMA
ncbi:hypothetical protein RchiOBHm_Chr1g0358901 [Rosa chinensis]|uniref:Uncharacterized protein n=1 Tax=Rosa chinensis TaxID=74649 RepID=A0A2P6SIA8_ROSCH|nr:hypothetical protein RchiOBHm_Chr1g0358901 [Rosa chinensis]